MTKQDDPQIFNPLQRKMLSCSLFILSLILMAATVSMIFFGLHWIVTYFSDILWPIVIAGILALLLRPLVLWFEHRLSAGRIGAIVILYGLVVIFLLLVAALVLPVILTQAQAFIEYLPALIEKSGNLLKKFLPYFSEWVDKFLDSVSASGLVQGLFGQFQDVYEASQPALN
ncbi:MAG: AI-2E family transporter, partial [Desulfovibrionales bacterium]|nr:AI-2E family transporter [Desulfovibrionales bacterium]